jgi:hypothetical protein
VDKHYPREEAFVLHLLERPRIVPTKGPWNPNSDKFQSGADVAFVSDEGRCIGVQVTEVDPFPKPGARGRERAQIRASASGVIGTYVQNDAGAALDAICRAIEKKVRIAPAQGMFSELWLLLCLGVPDTPTSTFIPTAPLAVADLDGKTKTLLLNSHYTECFILPFLGTEQAIYKWSSNETAKWKKSVRLEEIPLGTGDAEYVRELLLTGGKDEMVVDAQVRRVLTEIRETRHPSESAIGPK